MERELLLLGLLQRQEMHGYQLHEFIDRFMQTCVDLKKSTAYYLLEKMEREGLIVRSEEREGNRPLRHVYSLTPAGEARFLELLRDNLGNYLPARFPGDTAIPFLDDLPRVEVLALLESRRQALAQELARIEQAPPHAGTLQLMIEHQVVHLRSEMDWLNGLMEQLATAV